MTLRGLDDLQRRWAVLGFGWAVIRKYLDDGGFREAALITYYGFLSLFPVLLLGVAVVSRVLARRPGLRHDLVTAIVPAALRPGVEAFMAGLPATPTALAAGIAGLVFTGIGVVLSAYETLNHLAAVPVRRRAGVFARYVRAVAALVVLLTGTVALGALTVASTALPSLPLPARAVTVLGSVGVSFAVLLAVARLLLVRRAPFGALWPAAVIGAVAVTLLLHVGAAVLPGLVRRAGWIYGGFATVAGVFTLLYLLSNLLVVAAEVAVVRYARLWPRALDPRRPTAADARAMTLLVREQERMPAARIDYVLYSPAG
ncbi:YhjD/YihY/BrkB family envelope integrity protein [Actinoplanes sp. NEAU-A12]|uniref:YhjD/YihY/BrkB family envelope integrity protein n=1 Tax=Actinoplanes sandaracinus TaxID=3045177 RepID=A0ABT6WZT0_9ACTN|nr:YhjD/YihY/BrkB family envelope integrity protein [Actinoplanes sandaracinus]MDI6105258.1 YhjD/YihY/BrkB family envelope integrity protein [Actinoplanes sandaracinus]